jgi:phosphoribosylaminoimidazolecarboxamide formyltransferase/IMP cyclohydrolase
MYQSGGFDQLPIYFGRQSKNIASKGLRGHFIDDGDNAGDLDQVKEYEIPSIDMVVVDLYPFEATVASGAGEQDIIEKIDIGGISLIRAAAKNFEDVSGGVFHGAIWGSGGDT